MFEIIATLVYWISVLALVFSYLLYPLYLRWRAQGKTIDTQKILSDQELPQVSVLMAVHNEEAVIAEKLSSLLTQNYPTERLHFYLGSDNSNDQTNEIIQHAANQHTSLHFFPFSKRQGKPGVINQLAQAASSRYPPGKDHVYIITDASVLMSPGVCRQLCKHFKEPQLAIVDAHMVHTGMQEEDISGAEDTYISWEGGLKHHESIVWKKMIGPFGGCYALRSDFFVPVPDNFLVDDFYITMQAFRKGGLAINELQALCYEPVGHEIKEEFRRKARISAGNIQNMFTFTDLWLPPWGIPNFAIFSHKILRWLGPLWLILALVSSGLLTHNLFYRCLFILTGAAYTLPILLDALLRRFRIHWPLIRNVRYFLIMNLALLAGYFRYAKGIKSNVWQPPKRQ
jgi:glycosyltransferase involved in cell wall biosynthesis